MLSFLLCLGFIFGVSTSSVLVILHAMFNGDALDRNIY